jgi:hypothetical protein
MLLARPFRRVLVPLRSFPRKQASTIGSPLEPVPARAGTGMSGLCCAFGYKLSYVMAGLRPGHDAEGVACTSVQPPVFHIQLSNSSARRLAETCVITRILCRGPGQGLSPVSFSHPSAKARGMARQVTQPFVLCRPVFPLENTRAPLGAPPGQARAVRAYLPAFSLRHRAVLFVGRSNSKRTIRQPSSWRAALVGHQTGSRCRPGACLRGTPAGAASLLHHQTPLDDAPR